MNPESVRSSITRHMASPEVSLERHQRRRVHALGRELVTRKAIYLDLRFWIYLRDAARYNQSGPKLDLLMRLRCGVASGSFFCPITDSTFLELFKQSDPQSRAATAALIDELSLGVTLMPYDMRVGTEIAHYVHAATVPDTVDPLHELVWSKLSYVMGFIDPVSSELDQKVNLALQKAFFDHMWDNVNLMQMCDLLGDGFVNADPLRYLETTGRLNDQIRTHATELKSFKMAYTHELIGVLDLYSSRLANIMAHILPLEAGPLPAEGTAERLEVDRQCLALLMAAFDTEGGRKAMRTLHINTTLHAAVRWNKGQLLKANDLFDFHHACAAIGYCDAFFTEGPLQALVCRSDLALDKQFGLFVTSDISECCMYLDNRS